MALDLSIFTADESNVTDDLPATLAFDLGGDTVVGMIGESVHGQTLDPEGFLDRADAVARVLVSRFIIIQPYRNGTLTHVETGKRYRVATISKDPTNLTYVFGLVELTR